MKTTLMAFTALATILAVPGGAMAQGNFQAPKPVIQPQVVRPVIAPPVDTRRLTKDPSPIEIPEAEEPREGDQAAGQPGPTDRTSLGEAVAPEPIPDSGQATRLRRAPALASAPLPEEKPGGSIAEGSPQPEPPTLPEEETAGLREDGRLPGVDGLADEAGHLGLLEEVGRLKDIEEAMAGPGSAGGSLGGAGGGEQGPSGWRDWVPDPNTGEPQAPELWNPGLPGTAAYNPGMEQGGGFVPPPRKPRGPGNIPGFGQTPGSAGPSLGRDGRTGQDPAYVRTEYERTPDADGEGYTESVTWIFDDGSAVTRVSHYKSEKSDVSDSGIVFYTGPSDPRDADQESPAGEPDMTFTEEELWGPDSQPSPDGPASPGSMPCPATHRECGPGPAGVSAFDMVAQPGKGDEGGPESGFKASIEERRGVVTNPVDPGTQLNRRGGTGEVDYMHKVTTPGNPGEE